MNLKKTASLPGHVSHGISLRNDRDPKGSDRWSNIDMSFQDSVRSDTKTIAKIAKMLTNGRVRPLILNPYNSDRLGYAELGFS